MTLQADVAVAGQGVVPGLVALALTAREPSLRVALITADPEVGGNDLDLVFPGRLPPRFAALLAPLVVAEWDRALVNLQGGSEVLAEPVQLIDPVQLWLQLVERIDPALLIAGCAGFEHDDGALTWAGGQLTCGKLIDVGARRTPERVAEFVGADMLAALDCPVLADLAATGEHYDHLQYVPLGDSRVVINRFAATPAFAHNHADFGLSRLDELPLLRFWRGLGELCSGLLPG